MTKIDRMNMGDATIVRIQGDLDEGNADQLRNALQECINDGCTHLVLNLAEAGFVSYMSLGIIVERLRRFRAMQGDIKLVGVNTYLQRLMRMAGITALFDVFESESQAISGFKQVA